MGKIFCFIGKSASGKDTVCKKLLQEKKSLVYLPSYTTREARDGEQDGVDYHFVTEEFIAAKEKEGKLIEKSVRETDFGFETYATIDNGDVDPAGANYVVIKDPYGSKKLKEYYGEENVVVIMITVDDGIRLMRALTREMTQKNPRYAKLCKRYLDDEEDFEGAQYDFVCENSDIIKCIEEIKTIIKNYRK